MAVAYKGVSYNEDCCLKWGWLLITALLIMGIRVSERHSGFAKFDETPIFVFYMKNKDIMTH